MKKKNELSIKRIAEMVGVSPTTVSFVLNGKGEQFKIAGETRAKILNIASEYNYQPNFHARAMRAKKTFLIGVIVYHIDSSFTAQILAGISRELAASGFHMVLAESHRLPDKENEAFDFMAQIGVDGYIYAPVMNGNLPEIIHDAKQLRYKPLVSILHPVPDTPGVFTDHIIGAELIAEKLWNSGHRKVAYYGTISKDLNTRFDERYIGLRDFFRARGYEVPILKEQQVWESARDYTAIFCFSDDWAAQLFSILQKQGIRVPEDISLAGYSFSDPIHTYFQPQITSIMEYKEELGKVAVQRLLELVLNKNTSENLYSKLRPYLMEGETVKTIDVS